MLLKGSSGKHGRFALICTSNTSKTTNMNGAFSIASSFGTRLPTGWTVMASSSNAHSLLCGQATDWGPSILAPSNFTAGATRASSVPKTSTTEGLMAVKVDCLNLIEFLRSRGPKERCTVQKAEWSKDKSGKCCGNEAWREWMRQAPMQKVALFSERHQVVQNNEDGSSHKACYQNDFLRDAWRVARWQPNMVKSIHAG